MGKPISGVNKSPFGPLGVRVCGANFDSATTGDLYIIKQASSKQFKIGLDDTGVKQIDDITVGADATATETVSFLVGDVSFDVDVTNGDLTTEIATAIDAAATAADLESSVLGAVVSITHRNVGLEAVTSILDPGTGASISAAIATSGADPTTGDDLETRTAISKQKYLVSLVSNGIDITDVDADVASGLSSGEFAVRVYNSAGSVVGFVESFALNKVVVNTPSTGNVTDGVYQNGSYEIVPIAGAGTPVIPSNPTSDFYVEGRQSSDIDQ